jgi:dTDP-4-amino-4,6-dideoxygalactose transaminase
LRIYGWRHRYTSEVQSTVSRMDDLQAALLSAKLPHLDAWNATRQRLAALYASRLQGAVGLPPREGVFHLFVITTPDRTELKAYLADRGIGTDVHYPLPAHVQTPYAQFANGPLSHTERLANEVLSLPIYPELAEADVEYVCQALTAYGA